SQTRSLGASFFGESDKGTSPSLEETPGRIDSSIQRLTDLRLGPTGRHRLAQGDVYKLVVSQAIPLDVQLASHTQDHRSGLLHRLGDLLSRARALGVESRGNSVSCGVVLPETCLHRRLPQGAGFVDIVDLLGSTAQQESNVLVRRR